MWPCKYEPDAARHRWDRIMILHNDRRANNLPRGLTDAVTISDMSVLGDSYRFSCSSTLV